MATLAVWAKLCRSGHPVKGQRDAGVNMRSHPRIIKIFQCPGASISIGRGERHPKVAHG